MRAGASLNLKNLRRLRNLGRRPKAAAPIERLSSEELEMRRIMKTERIMIRIRWAGAAFGLVQALTFYKPYPAGVLPLALGLVGLLAGSNAALQLIARKIRTTQAARSMALGSLALDIGVVTGFVFAFVWDPATAIWALIYLLPLEAAIRFQLKGAVITMAVATAGYALREVYGAEVYHNPLLVTSITFRMGLGFLMAWVAGSMASGLIRERKRAEETYAREGRLAKMLRDVAGAANAAEHLEEAARVCLREVCELTGWSLGHLLVADPEGSGRMLSTEVWHCKDPHLHEEFCAASRDLIIQPGAGLAGRVAQEASPLWLPDLSFEEGDPRAEAAWAEGIRSGFAFPIISGTEVAGVLEFFSTSRHSRRRDLLEMVAFAGHQLGRVADREKATTSLLRSEQRRRRVIETANDAFISTDESGIIRDWNHKAEEMFGWTHEEAVGQPMIELVVPMEHRGAHTLGFERFISTGRPEVMGRNLELSALHRNGHEIPVEVRVWGFKDSGSWVFNAFLRDITERRLADERLLRESQRLADAQEIANLGNWEWDLETDSMRWSEQLFHILGLAHKHNTASWAAYLRRVHPDDREMVEEQVRLAVAADGSFEFDHRVRRPDGTERHVQCRGGVKEGVVRGTALDVTDRKRMEEELRETEERFRLLVLGVEDYAIIMLNPDATIASWNEGARRMDGYEPHEVLGRHVGILSVAEDRAAGRAEAVIARAAQEGRAEEDSWRLRKDGSTFWGSGIVTALRSPDGQLRGFCRITRDMTPQRKAEEALVRSADRLAKANRELTEAGLIKDHFLAITNHELRSPLTTILGFATTLRVNWDHIQEADRRDFIARIEGQGRRLSMLVEDLLTLSSAEAGAIHYQIQAVDLERAVQEAMAQIPERRLETGVPIGLRVAADPHRLNQALVNYLSNAFKYGEGVVSLEAAEVGGFVEVRVRDQGPGVPPEFLPKLFEKFSQAGQGQLTGNRGTGLGLAIVRQLVEDQGGQAWYEANRPKGSCFCFRLPAASVLVGAGA